MIAFLIGGLILLILWFVYDKLSHQNYPPGPLRLPIVGNLFQVARLSPYPAVAFQKLAEIYGDVFYVKIGFYETVVFNSSESVRYIRNHELCQIRASEKVPVMWTRQDFTPDKGMVGSSGETWQTLRRFTIRTLRDFGFGKASSMDVVINEEVDKLVKCIEEKISTWEKTGEIQETNYLYNLSTVNIVWRLVTGTNYELDNEKLYELLGYTNEIIKSLTLGADVASAFPFLYDLFPNRMGKNLQIQIFTKLKKFFKETINERREVGDYLQKPNCYIDVFLGKIEEEDNDLARFFTEEQLAMCLLDLFQAGSDTASIALKYYLLHMILNPEIQLKVQKEIDENTGKEEKIVLESRSKLPFTLATMLECMRYSTVIPILLPTASSEDIYYKGYLIRKGLVISPNIQAVHFEKNIWKDPHNFRPERFLTSEGKLDQDVKARMLSYGFGPRLCLGYSIGESVLFIYFATILKKFKLMKANESDVLTVEPDVGFTNAPKPFKVKYILRN